MDEKTKQVSRKIFWLASYPKSGNTWVRMFLDVYVTGFPAKFNSAYRYVNVDHDLAALQLVSAKPLTTLTLEDQFLYHPAMLANLVHQAKTKDVVIKTHNAKLTVSGMPLIPVPLSGGAIYIVRDPRDIVLSYASHMGKSAADTVPIMNDQGHITFSKRNHLFHVISSWSQHVTSWTQTKDFPVIIVRYEDLLSQPDNMFRQVLKALGVEEVDEAAFQFALEQTTFANLTKMEDEQGFIERSELSKDKFFRVGKVGQWKTGLLADQQDQLITDHVDVMKGLGYIA